MPLEIMDTTFLVTEICDKLTSCIELLQEADYLDKDKSLREIYNEKLHPSVLDLNDERLWTALAKGDVLDVFQFGEGVGLATAKQVKPRNPLEMTSANALMRLMGEKGKERPLDRYCRLKSDMSKWYDEVRDWGLTEEEIKVLEPYYLPNYGVPASQEDLMLVCLDPKIAHFTLKEANAARKVVAKKHIAEVPALKEKFVSQCPSRKLGEYVWETTMEPQMSYAFAKPHAMAYSFVGLQTLYLATNYPSIFWNCACLIIKAGGADLLELEIEDEDNEEEDVKKKKKNKTSDYGKIAKAIGDTRSKGIVVLPPDINKSDFIFKPDVERNAILYGLKGIARIGTDLVLQIVKNRPYSSIGDFLSKVKVNKAQMINLIKAGTFDELYECNREEIMNQYLLQIADQKKRITLQNMQMLIAKNLIPEKLDFERRLFNFNKYIKQFKEGAFYRLDSAAAKFFIENYEESLLQNLVANNEETTALIPQSKWDSIYKRDIEPIRVWMKANQQEILTTLNQVLYNETAEKYAEGNISKWEMESLSFYYHAHELSKLRSDIYNIEDFNKIKENEIDRQFITKDGDEITMFKIHRIAGTVIDKNKNKSTVTLLTTTGVVTMKVWKNQFAKWDKQISQRGEDGKKHVIEKSWFQRGTKLIVTGIKRDDTFVPKKYKSISYPLFEKIIELDDNGFILKSVTERVEEEE